MWTKKAATHLAIGILCVLLAVVSGSLGLALVGLMFILAVVGAYLVQRTVHLRHARTLSIDRVRENDHVNVKLTLTAGRAGTGFIEVRDRLDERVDVVAGSSYRILNIGRSHSGQMDYEMALPIRGVYGIGPVEVRKTDTMELFYNVHEVPSSIDGLTVLPVAEDLREVKIKALTPKILSGPNPVRQPGIGSQFYALREYTTADPMKDVNWKASARAGELIVNQWERESISVVTLILDARQVSGAGSVGGNPLLYNARAAATLSEYFTSERSTLRFVTYGDEVHTLQPDSGERQLHKIYEALAAVEARGRMPFADVVHLLVPRLETRAPVVVLSSLEEDDTFTDGITMLLARQMNVMVVAPSAPDFLRLAENADLEGAQYALRRLRHQHMVKRLRGLGVAVVHWEPEDRLEMALMGAMAAMQ